MSEPNVQNIVKYLNQKKITQPYAAVILGSGLGDFADRIDNKVSIPYTDIPGMPTVTVSGHAGSVYFGDVAGKKIIAFGGRFHGYEGHGIETTLCLVHIAAKMGVQLMLISNAAGSVTQRLNVGDLMLINDFMSPGYQFAQKDKPTYIRYDNKAFRGKILQIAAKCGIHLQHGTYFYVKGPTYETKAEVRAFRTMGADVCGMSTAPEMLESVRLGMNCIGITLVTNMATGVSAGKLHHSEVKETAETRKDDFARLITELIQSF